MENGSYTTDDLTGKGLVRGKRIWNHDGKRGLLDMSRSSFLEKVKKGILPVHPVKLGERTIAYRLSEIFAVANGGGRDDTQIDAKDCAGGK